jgi:hypothetical protein
VSDPTFVTDGAWGTGTGAQLPAATIDMNFWVIVLRLVALEAFVSGGGGSSGILSITQTGSDLYITTTDYVVHGPYSLMPNGFPLSFKGPWLPTTPYLVGDMVTNDGALYGINVAHTSPSSFDPGYQVGGNDVYINLMDLPQVLPSGGLTGQALTKNSDADLDVGWSYGLLPSGGSANMIPTKLSSTSFDYDWKPNASAVEEISAGTITLTLDDGNKFFFCAGACSVTIPKNSTTAFPVNTEIAFYHGGDDASPVTLVSEDVGVTTLDCPYNYQTISAMHGVVIVAKKTATDYWIISGPLQPFA